MFEKEANLHASIMAWDEEEDTWETIAERAYKAGAEFGYNKANEEHEGKCKTAYIKGIRTMANALKDYDRANGAWTDYFEHTVEEVLKRLLKESE